MESFSKLYFKILGYMEKNKDLLKNVQLNQIIKIDESIKKDRKLKNVIEIILKHPYIDEDSIKYKLFKRQKVFLKDFIKLKEIFIKYDMIYELS